MELTLVEKIAARHADGLAPGTVVRSGDFISIRPRHVMTHDNTGAVIPKFKQIGATTIAEVGRCRRFMPALASVTRRTSELPTIGRKLHTPSRPVRAELKVLFEY